MDIKSISTIALPQSCVYTKTSQQVSSVQNSQVSQPTETQQKKSFKKLPFVAAGLVLAGLGAYASCGKFQQKGVEKIVDDIAKELKADDLVAEVKQEIKKDIKKIHKKMKKKISPDVLAQNRNNTTNNMKIILPESTVKVSQHADNIKQQTEQAGERIQTNIPKHVQLFLPLPRKNEKFVCIGFNEGKPVYEKLENIVEKDVPPAKSAFDEAKKGLNLTNDGVIAKIIKNRQKIASEIDRIIAENTRDGHINLKIMGKVARDFASDKVGRGADRFHQAADILEQSYIREFIKKDGTTNRGVYNLYDFMKTDSELFSIYTLMPMEEAANRLNYLRYNDLIRCVGEKDMHPDMFFDKMFARLVEKTQFKGYNEAHKGMEVKVGV